MSGSSSRTQNTQQSSTQVTNINLQDTDGVAIAGSGNTVTTTDHGALDLAGRFVNSALDVGIEALRMGQTNLDTAASLAGRGLDTALDATRSALDFGESTVRSNEALATEAMRNIVDFGGVALGEVSGISREAISSVLDAGQGVLDFATGIFDSALRSQQDLTAQNLSGLTALARQTSESADDRVSRTAMYAFAAIAAVFVLPALFGARAR